MGDMISIELEGKAKEIYLKRMIKCLNAAYEEVRKNEGCACGDETCGHGPSMGLYTNMLSMLGYTPQWGIYPKLPQDLNTGFPMPTFVMGLISKKEELESKVEGMFTKLSRVIGYAEGQKLGIEAPTPEKAKGLFASLKRRMMQDTLLELLKAKIYGFTPEKEALLKSIGEYYQDEQEFFRELMFFRDLEGKNLIGSKCSQKVRAESLYFYDIEVDKKGVSLGNISLFGQFVSFPVYYRARILAALGKKELNEFLSAEELDKLFGHSQGDIFNYFMQKKNTEAVFVAKATFGPFYDENTAIKGKTQQIVKQAGEGFAMDVVTDKMKRGDTAFFKAGIFSKPKIIVEEEEKIVKICSSNLELALKEEFPDATIIKVE